MTDLDVLRHTVDTVNKWRTTHSRTHKEPLRARLQVFSRINSRDGNTSTIGFLDETKSPAESHELPAHMRLDISGQHEHDTRRFPPNSPRQYLHRKHTEGELLVVKRGSEIIVAAGIVAVRMYLGEGGHLVMMSTADYQEIVSSDVSSSSNDLDYVRSFPVPSRFLSRSPASDKGSTVNIFFAFVGKFVTLAAIDPSRKLRYHCMVLDRAWSGVDLPAPGK